MDIFLAGTYSDKKASKMCLPCPKNTYSPHQSTACRACNTDISYSEQGSETCLPRPPCSETDYYPIHKPCRNNKVIYLFQIWSNPQFIYLLLINLFSFFMGFRHK